MSHIFLLLLVAVAAAKSYPPRVYDLELAETYFKDFKTTYDRQYESAEENDARFEIFKQNLIKINEHNLKQKSYTYDINQFADLSQDEFIDTYTGFQSDRDIPKVEFHRGDVELPDSFDWREKGKVSAIKDQQDCGSCWAFSITGLLESASLIHLGPNETYSYSEQQILDCDSSGAKCKGGYPYKALEYIQNAGGLESENDYQYTAENSSECYFDKSKVALVVTKAETLNLNNDEDIKAALVKYGPLAFALDGQPIQRYSGGIMPCDNVEKDINHAVLLVGYGSDNGENYWLVKNSWGTSFGEGGFFRLKMGGDTCNFYDSGFYRAEVAKP